MLTSGFEFYSGKFSREYYLLEERWKDIFSKVGREDNFFKELKRKVKISRQFGDLFFRYAEKGRYYHTPKHIVGCLLELDCVKGLVKYPLELELGLIMHDAVYDARAKDNEERSAEYGYNLSLKLGASKDFAERKKRIVLVTDHKTTPRNIEEMFAVDIDLSIFGKSAEEFDEYEKNIRKEYVWKTDENFRERRTKVLTYFLERKNIYSTEFFRDKYEVIARRNLQRSIELL